MDTTKGVWIMRRDVEIDETENQRLQEEILAKLAQLGKLRVQDDALTFQGTRFILPASLAGRVGDAVEYLKRWERDQSATYAYGRTFRYRPWDGAAAFDRAMKATFGTSGLGEVTRTFFGDNPPQYQTIDVAYGQTAQVPWGEVSFAPIEATFTLGGTYSEELGPVFRLEVNAPKKYRAHIEAFFQVVEDELRSHSIYRGKAITAAEQPVFLNTGTVDRSKVIYSDEVMAHLDANVWSVIRHADAMRKIGLPIKRQVLLYGPYGTGKTLAGMLTAQTAQENGFTYIQVRAGEDDLYTALKTAQVYAPSVVMFEDIDVISTDRSDGVAKLLDVLDGVTNKGVEVMAVFTTNHPDKLHKGLMRPGRLDAVIELAGLDAGGIRRLVQATVPASLLGELDWNAVVKGFEGLLPAFAKEAIDRAQRYAMARSGGVPQRLETLDLVRAADGIRQQVRMMEGAPEHDNADNISLALSEIVGQTIRQHQVGGPNLPLVPVNGKGHS